MRLTEAARIAAPHVIQARAARDVERRIRGEMLLAVLEGRASAEENATRLGFVANARFTVLAFSAVRARRSTSSSASGSSISSACTARRCTVQSAAIAIGENVYALLAGGRRGPSASEWCASPGKRRAMPGRESAAASSRRSARPSTASGRWRAARREAERVLEVLRSGRVPQTLATIEDVRSQVVLLELKELKLEHPGLMRGKLTAVLEHDAEHGTQYALTLRAYLDAMGDVVGAAAGISVHPNTFRYRLRRLGELFDIDLKNAEERLVLELQLRLLGDDAL